MVTLHLWGQKYPVVIERWHAIRRSSHSIFSTLSQLGRSSTNNAVEGFHRQVRKVTKTQGAFTNDISLLELVYLAPRTSKKNGQLLCIIGALQFSNFKLNPVTGYDWL